MARRNADPSFVREQLEQRYVPHIAPVNRLVDELSTDDRWMPYVSPLYGGTNSRVLFLFQDPGPATHEQRGSGMLSNENDDPSAELFTQCLVAARLAPSDVITWNAYPWYIPSQKPPTARMLDDGIEPLRRLLSELPELSSVCLCGRVAQDAWRRFDRRHHRLASTYLAVPMLHTSRRGITNGGQHSREHGIQQVVHAIKVAAGAQHPL